MSTITLTFGEVAESHVGMQKLGAMAEDGFTHADLIAAQDYFRARDVDTALVHLNDMLPDDGDEDLMWARHAPECQAYVLVVRGGLDCLLNQNQCETRELLREVTARPWDAKLYNERRGVVQNKLARHNLNFDEDAQEADFPRGRGTTVPWSQVPILKALRDSLEEAFGPRARDLRCEGNMYYAPGKTGISYHGDLERRRVIGARLGAPMRLHYTWYYHNRPRGTNVSVELRGGDMYVMSAKAVGTDWKRSSVYTLRHAAGADKYTIRTDKVRVVDREPRGPDLTVGRILTRNGKDWV
jgi:alkylated DNA repair dioxygenase AlkB